MMRIILRNFKKINCKGAYTIKCKNMYLVRFDIKSIDVLLSYKR